MHICWGGGGAWAAATGVVSCPRRTAPAVSGELAQCLPALHPVDNLPWLCTCMLTRVSLVTAYQHCLMSTTGTGRVPEQIPGRPATAFTGVDFHRQADLNVYLHPCTGELVQRLLALPRVDNRPQICHASWCSAYRLCLLLTTGPSCVPAHILGELAHRLPTLPPVDNRAYTCTRVPGRAGSGLPALPLVVKPPRTWTWARTSASWRSTCQRYVLLKVGSD